MFSTLEGFNSSKNDGFIIVPENGKAKVVIKTEGKLKEIEKEKLVEIWEMNGIDNKHLIMIKGVIENYVYLII